MERREPTVTPLSIANAQCLDACQTETQWPGRLAWAVIWRMTIAAMGSRGLPLSSPENKLFPIFVSACRSIQAKHIALFLCAAEVLVTCWVPQITGVAPSVLIHSVRLVIVPYLIQPSLSLSIYRRHASRSLNGRVYWFLYYLSIAMSYTVVSIQTRWYKIFSIPSGFLPMLIEKY